MREKDGTVLIFASMRAKSIPLMLKTNGGTCTKELGLLVTVANALKSTRRTSEREKKTGLHLLAVLDKPVRLPS